MRLIHHQPVFTLSIISSLQPFSTSAVLPYINFQNQLTSKHSPSTISSKFSPSTSSLHQPSALIPFVRLALTIGTDMQLNVLLVAAALGDLAMATYTVSLYKKKDCGGGVNFRCQNIAA